MATLSNNDIARAIYLASKDKTDVELKGVYGKVTKFLARRRLLSKTKNILERLEKIINQENERIEVKVSSARKLGEESKKELASFLKKRYEVKGVVFEEKLDEKLLGGMRLEINDEIIDLTAKNKIKKLQEHLTRKI
jgi:F-type H+-transporting ATPase subunit delta